MKLIILPLLLVLWGMPLAGAAEIECQKPNCVKFALPDIPPGGQVKIGVKVQSVADAERQTDGVLRVENGTVCEVIMRQAMQAMDKSMPQFFRKMILSGRTYWEFTNQDGSGFTMTEAQAQAYWEMLDQWERAKACWQEPTP